MGQCNACARSLSIGQTFMLPDLCSCCSRPLGKTAEASTSAGSSLQFSLAEDLGGAGHRCWAGLCTVAICVAAGMCPCMSGHSLGYVTRVWRQLAASQTHHQWLSPVVPNSPAFCGRLRPQTSGGLLVAQQARQRGSTGQIRPIGCLTPLIYGCNNQIPVLFQKLILRHFSFSNNALPAVSTCSFLYCTRLHILKP